MLYLFRLYIMKWIVILKQKKKLFETSSIIRQLKLMVKDVKIPSKKYNVGKDNFVREWSKL